MTLFKETTDGFVPWDGKAISGLLPPPDIETKWDSSELAAIGLFIPEPADEVPEGFEITDARVERVNGVIKWVYSMQPAAMPNLTMRQMRLGLKNIGGLSKDFILDVINTEIPAGTHRDDAIIWYEETSVVEWDHPMTQALMLLSGIPEDQAVAMWLAAAKIPA